MNKQLFIDKLTEWEKDIGQHLKYMQVSSRVEASLVLNQMLRFKASLEQEVEDEYKNNEHKEL